MNAVADLYKRHRFPAEIISHVVWLYFRFSLSYRDIEEMMAERGVILSYETVRNWCSKFGQIFANRLKRCRPQPGDKWHLNEVFLSINGKRSYLWRAVFAQFYVDEVAFFVDCPVEIAPLPLDLHIGLVHVPLSASLTARRFLSSSARSGAKRLPSPALPHE